VGTGLIAIGLSGSLPETTVRRNRAPPRFRAPSRSPVAPSSSDTRAIRCAPDTACRRRSPGPQRLRALCAAARVQRTRGWARAAAAQPSTLFPHLRWMGLHSTAWHGTAWGGRLCPAQAVRPCERAAAA
jgi:hypothetical protein